MYSGFCFNLVEGKELEGKKKKMVDFGFLLVMFWWMKDLSLAGIFALLTFSFCFV